MVIESRKEYQEALDTIQTLLAKGINELTKDEKARLNVLSEAIEEYNLHYSASTGRYTITRVND